MRICELKQREVINVKDCKRLGFVGDVDFDISTGKMLAIIVPGPGCVCGFLGREKEFVIPFGDICQIGDDIILVRVEEKKEKPDTAAILRMIPEIVNCAKKPLEMALGDLCLHHLQLYAMVARQDSAQAALDTQKLVSAVYTALAAAQNWIRVRHADIRLRPDFSGGEESSWAVRLRLSFHPIVMLAAALRFAFCLLRLLLAQKKKEQPEEPEKQTA